MNAKITFNGHGFGTVPTFFIFNVLLLRQTFNQRKIAVAATCNPCYIFSLTVWTERHSSLLSIHHHSSNVQKRRRLKIQRPSPIIIYLLLQRKRKSMKPTRNRNEPFFTYLRYNHYLNVSIRKFFSTSTNRCVITRGRVIAEPTTTA